MVVDVAVYRDGRREECADPSAAMQQLADEPADRHRRAFVWVGLQDPTEEEFASVRDALDLHPVAIDDALSDNLRPRIEVYDRTVVAVINTLRYLPETRDVETGHVVVFVGDRYVLTARYGQADDLRGVRQHLESAPRHLARGPLAVLHTVMDHVVDVYLSVADELESAIDDAEEQVFSPTSRVDITDIYRLKREVLEVKRAAGPLTLPLRRFVAGELGYPLPEPMRPFFSQVLQHLLQVAEHADGYSMLLSDLVSAHLTQLSVRQNDDMRRISAWVAILAVPTLITGLYGMNFQHMPELSWRYGYPLVLGVIAVICLTLFVLFRRARWL